MSSVQNTDPSIALLRGFDPVKLTEEVVRLGEEWAHNDAAASSLEETKKTLLAKLTLEYLWGGASSGALGEKAKSLPVSQAEAKALSDPRYEQHLDLMVAARSEAHRSRVRYDMGRMRLELVRTQMATLRNEMRLSGMT